MDRRQYLLASGTAVASIIGGMGTVTADAGGESPAQVDGSDDGTDTPTDGAPVTASSAPEPITSSYSGSGEATLHEFEVERDGPTVLRMSHAEGGDYSVEVSDADGVQFDLTATHDGAWSATYATSLAEGPCELSAGAAGDWSIDVVQYPVYGGDDFETEWPVEFGGDTADVYGPVDFSAERTLSVSASGDGTNAVTVRDAAGEIVALPVQSTGPVEATETVSVDADVGWITAKAAGEYAVTVEE